MEEQLKSKEQEKVVSQEAAYKNLKREHIAQEQLRKYLRRRAGSPQFEKGNQLKTKSETRLITTQINVQPIDDEGLIHEAKDPQVMEKLEIVRERVEEVKKIKLQENEPIDFANLPKTALIDPPQQESKEEPTEHNPPADKKDFIAEISNTSTLIERRKQLLMRYRLI
jgi:hypothetical protein